MKLINENYQIWYDEYKKQRAKSEKFIKSRKGKVRTYVSSGEEKAIEVSSFRDFKADFNSYMRDNPKLSGKQIARKMAKNEVFKLSYDQAEKLAEAHVKQFGGKASLGLINKYRSYSSGSTGIFSATELRRAELEKAYPGYSTYQLNKLIGQEFFGSPA